MIPPVNGVIVYKGKILLMLRDDLPFIAAPNTWSPPGGGIDKGETPDEAVRRELQEEICMVPAQLNYMGMWKFENVEAHGYCAELSDEEAKRVKLGDEGQKLEFFSFDELKNLTLSPAFGEYIKLHADMLKQLIEKRVLIN